MSRAAPSFALSNSRDLSADPPTIDKSSLASDDSTAGDFAGLGGAESEPEGSGAVLSRCAQARASLVAHRPSVVGTPRPPTTERVEGRWGGVSTIQRKAWPQFAAYDAATNRVLAVADDLGELYANLAQDTPAFRLVEIPGTADSLRTGPLVMPAGG